MDSSQKKIFTGDTDGNLQVYNYSNGAILRKLDSHKSFISQLIFCPQSKCIISASWDSLLNVHDELDFNKKGRSVLRSTSRFVINKTRSDNSQP
jgi:WD40 repeat protein